MKKYIIIGAVVVAASLFAVNASSTYNKLVPIEEKVNLSYSEYQNQLKRQADLIPNLAEIVKGYMNSEQKTMIDTAMARSGDLSKMKPADVANDPALQKKLVDAQASMGRAMVTLNAVREAYPVLKADKQVDRLMVELSGTQNRVTVARFENQKTVNNYNLEVRKFPGLITARIIGFGVKPYFAAAESEQNAPKINFK